MNINLEDGNVVCPKCGNTEKKSMGPTTCRDVRDARIKIKTGPR